MEVDDLNHNTVENIPFNTIEYIMIKFKQNKNIFF